MAATTGSPSSGASRPDEKRSQSAQNSAGASIWSRRFDRYSQSWAYISSRYGHSWRSMSHSWSRASSVRSGESHTPSSKLSGINGLSNSNAASTNGMAPCAPMAQGRGNVGNQRPRGIPYELLDPAVVDFAGEMPDHDEGPFGLGGAFQAATPGAVTPGVGVGEIRCDAMSGFRIVDHLPRRCFSVPLLPSGSSLTRRAASSRAGFDRRAARVEGGRRWASRSRRRWSPRTG